MTSSLERAKKHMHVVFHLETGLLSHFISKEEFDLWPAQVAAQAACIKRATSTLPLPLNPDDRCAVLFFPSLTASSSPI
jgi:hypothetical protein